MTYKEKCEYSIVPLSVMNILPAIRLIRNVFYYVYPFRAPRYLLISLLPKYFQNLLLYFSKIDQLKYWVLFDRSGKLIGTTGLYHYKSDQKDILWLGWFCIHQNKRGLGLGNFLLNYTINKAISKNAKKLKLYTSDLKEESSAQILYEKFGFNIVRQEKTNKGFTILFRVKDLN